MKARSHAREAPSLAVLAGFLFLTLFYSRQLPAAAGAPRVGAKAPDFVLPDAQGRPVRLSQVLQGKRAARPAPGCS